MSEQTPTPVSLCCVQMCSVLVDSKIKRKKLLVFHQHPSHKVFWRSHFSRVGESDVLFRNVPVWTHETDQLGRRRGRGSWRLFPRIPWHAGGIAVSQGQKNHFRYYIVMEVDCDREQIHFFFSLMKHSVLCSWKCVSALTCHCPNCKPSWKAPNYNDMMLVF